MFVVSGKRYTYPNADQRQFARRFYKIHRRFHDRQEARLHIVEMLDAWEAIGEEGSDA